MRNKIIYLCFISFLFLGNVFCDTIALKSGKQIEGNIKERTNDAVKVDIEGITITYYITDIDSINGQKITINQQAVVSEGTKPESKPMPTEYPGGTEESSGLQSSPTPAVSNETIPEAAQKSIPGSGQETSMPLDREESGSFKMSSGSKQSTVSPALAAGVVGGIILLALIFLLITYVYSSICLQFIAKKTGSEPLFLAWIPFAHYFLRFKIAKMSYLWIFVPVGLFVVGFLGGLFSSLGSVMGGASKAAMAAKPIFVIMNFFFTTIYAAFSGFLWYKISLARNKKGWIGALMAISILNGIPFVSFLSVIGCGVIMGYLAFSE
ncbi:MAG: hypothetical protein WC546_04520 [Candidatus Omnitrophota bacterium]|jgi:hypothetical protein